MRLPVGSEHSAHDVSNALWAVQGLLERVWPALHSMRQIVQNSR